MIEIPLRIGIISAQKCPPESLPHDVLWVRNGKIQKKNTKEKYKRIPKLIQAYAQKYFVANLSGYSHLKMCIFF